MPAYQFNSNGVDPSYGAGGSYLPPGKHPVVIVASELKPTKDTTGGYLALTLEAIDGPAKGVQMVDRLNLHNKSAEAVRIANQQLSAYCHVIGVFAFNATEELHGKPFVVETKVRSDNANQTEIAALFDINGNPPGHAGAGAPAGGGNTAWGGAPAGNQGGGQPAAGGAWGGQPAGQQQGGEQQQGAAGGAWGAGNQGGGAAPSGGAPGWSQQGGGGGQPAWGAR
jgi:hypothetical protein